ncbi:MAG: Glycerol-3-phosphate acyltransferase, partial [Gemmatimonadetes bacterium]|nr:Glycerol-3-phosphate acyltransferase [Gemmatimonadota bacterium]
VTHVVHAAASVKFDWPLAQAARVNVAASLNVLALATNCPCVERFVYVSTAYVMPDMDGAPILEEPAPLPRSAQALYADCISGRMSEAALLAETNHPNSYTLTKAIAEHLLTEARGALPLTIMRPSIIAASRQFPFPAWIDSSAGYASFAILVGTGHLRALVCRSEAQLDLVPVDDVTQRILSACIGDSRPMQIRHAVVGVRHARTIAQCWDSAQRYFRIHRVDKRPQGRYLGPRNARFRIEDFVRHRVPAVTAGMQSRAKKRQAQKRAARLSYLNKEFTYFTTRTFNFESSVPIDDTFDGGEFLETMNRGVYRHLLECDDKIWVLGGHAHPGHDGDARWVVGQRSGNVWIRGACWLTTKLLRRAVNAVTVDVPSFERARAALPADATLVLTPSHRSYLDFVLCSYLAFARPDLIPIPHIAATMEFARIPILGRILKSMHAFYLRRSQGAPDSGLAERVRELVDEGNTLAFFIEGARSRTNEFLAPKRGLLRCLQATGRTCALMPISISYERVPEQETFAREIAGEPKAQMRFGVLIAWCIAAWRRQFDLGRIHIACGDLVLLEPASDVHAVSHAIIRQLRGAMRAAPADANDPLSLDHGWTEAPSAEVWIGANTAQ